VDQSEISEEYVCASESYVDPASSRLLYMHLTFLDQNVMQQFTGSNMINYLAPIVYEQTMHLSRNLSLVLGGCTAITYMFASFLPLWVCPFSSFVLCVCLYLLNYAIDSRPIRPTSFAHDFCSRLILMFYHRCSVTFHRRNKRSLRCHRDGVHIPDILGLRIFADCKWTVHVGNTFCNSKMVFV